MTGALGCQVTGALWCAPVSTEFQRIARFTSAFRLQAPSVVAGPGDDCALTRPRPGRLLVSKVDQVVEGVHFTAAFKPEEIGHKALAVALSDLAAAGAEPRWFLVAVAMPGSVSDRTLAGIARGMSRLADTQGATLIGGNFTRSDKLSLTVTTLGEARPERALRRSGGKPGDLLVVSGHLGEAALGVRLLSHGRPKRITAAARAQLAPTPRNRLGSILGRWADAAVDLSDGLLQDLGHLCARSGVGASIARAALPLGPEVARLGDEGLRLALTGGEDYELLASVPKAKLAALQRAASRLGEKLTAIGRLERTPGIRLLDEEGRSLPLPGSRGWEHFR